jgi:2-keto-4-pentenoate hydratase
LRGKKLSKDQRQVAGSTVSPKQCGPPRAEGYAIQSFIESRNAKPIGRKIAATSRDGQAHIGVDGPLAGRLAAERIVAGAATLPLKTDRFLLHPARLSDV